MLGRNASGTVARTALAQHYRGRTYGATEGVTESGRTGTITPGDGIQALRSWMQAQIYAYVRLSEGSLNEYGVDAEEWEKT